jgi:hypothetical protein
MNRFDLFLILTIFIPPLIGLSLNKWRFPDPTDAQKLEKFIKSGQMMISTVGLIMSLPFMYGFWSEDFIFADKHPRTLRGWLYFLGFVLLNIATQVAMYRWKQKVIRKSADTTSKVP